MAQPRVLRRLHPPSFCQVTKKFNLLMQAFICVLYLTCTQREFEGAEKFNFFSCFPSISNLVLSVTVALKTSKIWPQWRWNAYFLKNHKNDQAVKGFALLLLNALPNWAIFWNEKINFWFKHPQVKPCLCAWTLLPWYYSGVVVCLL